MVPKAKGHLEADRWMETMTFKGRVLKLHPSILVLISFLLAILVGAVLLKLPVSTETGFISWVDALFTAASAVCVTGLVVVDTGSYFTQFGQTVILVLIQIGGLGVMTISVMLFRWLGRSISIRHRMVMQDLFAHTPRSDIFALVRRILFFTFGAEFLGAVALLIRWNGEQPFPRLLFSSIFHSVSAYCNAGFSLFSDNMMRYRDDLTVNATICILIVAGGIGFPVLHDLRNWLGKKKTERARLSVQTKTVLATTAVLIVGGALMFGYLEGSGGGDGGSTAHRVLVPLFQSITCRTAGFNTVDIGSLKDATLAMMIFLMFFGASPGSCGGGVKTTTLAILSAFTLSRLRRKKRVNLFRKSIPHETIARSVSLTLVSLSVIGIVLFLLLAGDSASGHPSAGPQRTFLAYLFETVSAFGTVGLSMGLTPDLSVWDKCWVIGMMIVGRVGVLSFGYILVGSGTENGIEYSEENMMVG